VEAGDLIVTQLTDTVIVVMLASAALTRGDRRPAARLGHAD
jgi:hypothetical protein